MAHSASLHTQPATEKPVVAPLEDYDCAICKRVVETRWARHWRGPGRLRPPCCARCEQDHGKPATDGAFGDRRTVSVGSALAEALSCEAHRATWPEAWR